MTTQPIFQQLSEVEHVLACPDVYMGALVNTDKDVPIYDHTTNTVSIQHVTFNTGILKVFDEILTNAADNLQRSSSHITTIAVDVDPSTSTISVYNDGCLIPITRDPSTSIYIPELIFTRFRAGSNFAVKSKTTGGKNGIGAKLTSVYSTTFTIELNSDHHFYTQTISSNNTVIDEPIITSSTDPTNWIRITFTLDTARLKSPLTPDNVLVINKRVHDLTHLPVDIYLNGDLLPRLSWQQYASMFPISPQLFTFETRDWKIAFGVATDRSRIISYVNNIATYEGGEHVKYILSQLHSRIATVFASGKPDVTLNIATLKSKLSIIIYSIIEDPLFTSQAKEKLSTKPSSFGTSCTIPASIIDAFIANTPIIELLTPPSRTSKPTKRKTGKLTSIEQLVEANMAGTSEGYKCTLFLCEGLSAKTMCDKGIGILGHDYFGCYPLRGKVLNARNASDNKYDANRELTDICDIIGLVNGQTYTSTRDLRYGKVVCVKDADADGAAIMGLVINFFESKFPSLLRIPGFFSEFVSPMIKVVYNANDPSRRTVIPFYNEVEYKLFIDNVRRRRDPNAASSISIDDIDPNLLSRMTLPQPRDGKFNVEFIKGLATNEDDDVIEYFTHYDDNVIEIQFPDQCDQWLDMAFNAKRTDHRKLWLSTITPDTCLPRQKGVPISVIDFIRSELVLFGHDACMRSIPSVIDGLKPSQRKILYTLFGMGAKAYEKMKVFQLGGLVAKKANYHHGDASINATIIGMAQDYPTCGNNIPLLKRSGQFGSRNCCGMDHGAPRYIACSLGRLTRLIYPAVDDSLCIVKEEDNQVVEPLYYVPIIPMVLVNGAKGIGTGWSTDVPSFSVKDVIKCVKGMLKGEDVSHIRSMYNGFSGKVTEERDGWVYSGVVRKRDSKTFDVKELPIRYSITKLRNRLNYLMELHEVSKMKNVKGKEAAMEALEKRAKKMKVNFTPIVEVVSYVDRGTSDVIDMEVTFAKTMTIKDVMDVLGLTLSVKNTNMVAFDVEYCIAKYESIAEMVREWWDVRYEMYVKRIEKLREEMKREMERLSNKARFVKENVEGKMDVKGKRKVVIVKELERNGYAKLSGKDEEEGYDYLLSMKIWSLTKEKYDELMRKVKDAEERLDRMMRMTVEEMWMDEVVGLEKALDKECV